MVEIENAVYFGLEGAIRGMRNALESWDKSDSTFDDGIRIGVEDRRLMKKLVAAGTDHSKFMRMIHVQMDVTAPLYFWKQLDTYKVGTVANSCSTMHKIQAHEFTRDMFSIEHLSESNLIIFDSVIEALNIAREKYLETKDKENWWQMIQLLPDSYNQKRTLDLNYQVLRNMYHARKGHKLDEWHQFCDWIKTLPLADLIVE